MSGRKLARRACDGCKVRKIKCSETSPCDGCRNAGIACTWLKQAQPRGPRRLRDATLLEIRKAQDILQSQSQAAANARSSRSPNVTDPDPPPKPSSEISQLVLFLCVYRLQLYPIWPIIKVERLIASLQSDNPDIEVFALAYALAAATATRSRSMDLGIMKRNHAKILEEKCQAARAKVPQGRPPNLTTVRIAFFLHAYYESQEASSMKSMLYLREAVTIAQMIGLHREPYYADVPAQEREIRRRVLWLLFVTERAVAILYEQPITLRTKITVPSTTDTDEIDVLVGFQLLVRLFWTLDEAGLFTLLDELDSQASPSSNGGSAIPATDYASLIEADASYSGFIPSVQDLELSIARTWLQFVNLRMQQTSLAELIDSGSQTPGVLLSALERMLSTLEKSPSTSVEALGITMHTKVSSIFTGLRDLIAAAPDESDRQPIHDILQSAFERLQVIPHFSTGKYFDHMPSLSAFSPATRTGRTSLNRHEAAFNSSPNSQSSKNDNSHAARSIHVSPPSNSQYAPMHYHTIDYSYNNNYDGLFEAVELAGVESSDSVEDLFSQASFEPYRTFDEGPAVSQTGRQNHENINLWHNPPSSWFDLT